MASTLNLGILAHVDAGKTSLTERLLHAVGVIDRIGSVDRGDTQTDSLALERQRGITIKSAVVSFPLDGVTVNLIDTPGHPDFIAEVERVLGVLDGAVLVVSAVEGVQAQTRVLMRVLRRLGIPTLIFVNKVDRRGARPDDVLERVSDVLTSAVVAMGSVAFPGTADACVCPFGASDVEFVKRLTDVVSEHDDDLLADYLDDEGTVTCRRLRKGLASLSRRALVHPVLFGSAITGAGVDALLAGVRELLPAVEGDPEGPLSGTVFKVERGAAGEKVAYVRMHSGTLRVRDRIPFGAGKSGKVTAVGLFEAGSAVSADSVTAGRIAKVRGLAEVQVGDCVGERVTREAPQHFSPPTLEAVVVPVRAADRIPLHAALTQLAEQDPLIDLRRDEARREIAVSLYGEVQKEVIQATLADDFGLQVAFRETTTVYVERPVGKGSAAEFIFVAPNPFYATVGLRVEAASAGPSTIGPADAGTSTVGAASVDGVEFGLEVELGSLPYAFFKAVEETVRDTLSQGLHGWQVTGCRVTMTHSGFDSIVSTAGDFRALTPLVVMEALKAAGTRVHEPVLRFLLDIPEDTFEAVLTVLPRLQAIPRTSTRRTPIGRTFTGRTFTGTGASRTEVSLVVEGDIPAARLHELQRRLPSLTRGEGVLESAFDRYEPVRGAAPTRPRGDRNPLNRQEYLLHVAHRD